MTILAIETTGPLASVAINKDGKAIYTINDKGFSHLQECVPMVKALMEEDGVSELEQYIWGVRDTHRHGYRKGSGSGLGQAHS